MKSCGRIGTLIKPQLVSVFVCFHSLLSVHLLKFLARSCKILQIRGFLGKNLGKILTKKSKNVQDSYQELQEFLHWVNIRCFYFPIRATFVVPFPTACVLFVFSDIRTCCTETLSFLKFLTLGFANSMRVVNINYRPAIEMDCVLRPSIQGSIWLQYLPRTVSPYS